MKRQIILDTETTGFDPEESARIIEIAALELIDGRPTGNAFHTYLNPDCDISEEVADVIGLDSSALIGAPRFSDIAEALVQFITGAELIIHNAPFDVPFLNNEFKLDGARFGPVESLCTITDSLAIARRLYPGQRCSLDALCKRLGIDSRNPGYTALHDAKRLVDVYTGLIRNIGQ